MRAQSGERNARDRAMLAVLPLKNLGAPADQYFADGLTEEITSRLAGVGALGVISRTSAEQYRDPRKPLKEVGRELGVGYILEGSVRWEKTPGGQGRIRVTPQLIRVRAGRRSGSAPPKRRCGSSSGRWRWIPRSPRPTSVSRRRIR
jgi:TolB-like protein